MTRNRAPAHFPQQRRTDRGAEVAEDIARVRRFLRDTIALVGAQVTPIREGVVLRHDGLAQVWSLNQVRLSEPIDYAGALTLAEEHLVDLPYRQLVVEHESSGRQLEALLRADGWEVEREVLMTLGRAPGRAVDSRRSWRLARRTRST